MAINEQALRPVPQLISHKIDQPRQTKRWIDWVTTTDHKKIGILYLVTTFVFFMLGGVEALLMRVQLGQPNNTLLSGEHYNELLTMHGTTMVFLFVVPIMAGFGNYFVPLMIGARDMAFPRLNALSYWLLLFGGIVFYATLFFHPPEAGWWSLRYASPPRAGSCGTRTAVSISSGASAVTVASARPSAATSPIP